MLLEKLKVMYAQRKCEHHWRLNKIVVRLPNEKFNTYEYLDDNLPPDIIENYAFECWLEPYQYKCEKCKKTKPYPREQRCEHDWRPIDKEDINKNWRKHFDIVLHYEFKEGDAIAVCSKCGAYRYRLINAHSADVGMPSHALDG